MTTPPSPAHKPPSRGPGLATFVAMVLGITLGIVRDQKIRRTVLFFIMLAVMLLLFVGMALLDRWLSARPFLFLLYWGACLWFTFLSILLALYDMLMVRKMAQQERRRLAEEMRDEVRSELSNPEHRHDDSDPRKS